MGNGSAFEYKVTEPGLTHGPGPSRWRRKEIKTETHSLGLCYAFPKGVRGPQITPSWSHCCQQVLTSAWSERRIRVESHDSGCQRESNAHLWEEWRETHSQGDSLPGHSAYQTWASGATGQGESRQSDWCRWPFWKSPILPWIQLCPCWIRLRYWEFLLPKCCTDFTQHHAMLWLSYPLRIYTSSSYLMCSTPRFVFL